MKQISRSAFYLLASETFIKFFLFLSNLYLARVLGSSFYGLIIFGFSFMTYPAMAGSAGIEIYGQIETGKKRKDRLSDPGEIFFVKFINSNLVLILFILGILLFVNEIPLKILLILFSANLFTESLFLDWFFKGIKQFNVVALLRTVAYTNKFTIIKKRGTFNISASDLTNVYKRNK